MNLLNNDTIVVSIKSIDKIGLKRKTNLLTITIATLQVAIATLPLFLHGEGDSGMVTAISTSFAAIVSLPLTIKNTEYKMFDTNKWHIEEKPIQK